VIVVDDMELMAAFVAALPPERAVAPGAELAALIWRLVEQGRSAHPELSVDPAAFVRHVAGLLPVEGGLAPGLTGLQEADLYLAYACGGGDPVALRKFEAELFPELEALIKGSPQPTDADVVQLIRERLFVPRREQPPRILDYRGQSELRNWFRLVALRVLANLSRGAVSDDQAERAFSEQLLSMTTADNELRYLKAKYRAEFAAAVPHAFASLTPRERNLLRLSLLEGLSIDQLGAVHGVHRATVARWIVSTKASLAKALHRELKARLKVDQKELESILRLIESQVHLTLERLFEGEGETTPP
jgi:RNA polymerase sigma-70 factor (ECF subfamily)